MSHVVDDHQIEAGQPLGVGEQLDPGDGAAREIYVSGVDGLRKPSQVDLVRDREQEHHPRLPARRPCRCGHAGYWYVDDVQASVTGLLDAGAVAGQEVRDVGGGWLVASVADADSIAIGLIRSA